MRQKIINFFTHKWTLGIIGLMAFACVIGFGSDFIKFGENNTTLASSTRLLIIGVVTLTWFVWQLSTYLLERKSNKAFTEEIQADNTSNDDNRSTEERNNINQRFSDALNTLKKRKLSSNAKGKSIYQLPWYIIIGPPGAGKTTALINSGLQFPMADGGIKPLSGVGGTKDCDWWFSNEAVLIDTAGRFTTQDSHRAIDNTGWHSFLALLKKYRRRRPINGAIIAISIQDLMVQTASQRAQTAQAIKARLEELQTKLGIDYPCYLCFTKCDLIAGFSEYFSDLNQQQREQVLGVTFDDQQNTAIEQQFEQQYSEILTRLNSQLINKTHAERDIEKRSLLLNFPARMEDLSGVLNEFLAQIVATNNYSQTTRLRGVYFTSATQQGHPIDRMMSSVSASFGLDREAPRQLAAAGKSFFLSTLLQRVVFHEAEIVGADKKVERTISSLRYLSFASIAVVFTAAVVIWFGSIGLNKSQIITVDEHIATAQNHLPQTGDKTALSTLNALNSYRAAADIYNQQNHPIIANFGLYDNSLKESTNRLYQQQLRQLLLPRINHAMEAQLLSLTAKEDELLDLFKTYLGFVENKPGANDSVQQWLVNHWQSTLSGKASEIDQLQGHLSNLLAQPSLRYGGNPRVIASARRKLKTTPASQRLYSNLKSQYRDINTELYSKIGPDTQLAFSLNQQSKPLNPSYLFTKQGYKELDLSADSDLINNMSADRWIYGDENIDDFTDADKQRLSDELKKLYFSDYNNTWGQYLDALQLQRLRNMSQAVEALNVLADPIYSPLLTSLETATANTQLQPAVNNPLEGKMKAADKLTELVNSKIQPTPVDNNFSKLQQLTVSQRNQPAKISHYLTVIGNVQMYLAEIDSAPDRQLASFEAAKARYSGQKTPLNKLMIEARTAPQPVKSWLKQIADDSWKIILADAKSHINQLWKRQVFTNYQRYLSNRYPLSNSSNEIPIDDFNSYFSPSGIEKTFVTENLSAFINTQKWQNKVIDGRSLNIATASLKQFKNATEIRNSLYQKGDEASVGFKLEPTKLDSSVRQFEVSIGNSSLQYSHGPRIATRFDWQGGIDMGARIHFEDLNNTGRNEQYQGDWALFRMLDAANIRPGATRNYFAITFNKDGRKADFKLTAISAKNPFNRSTFNRYRCPERL
ncbi:hypothetical protein SIN8267_00231 [Sinobacterium norvegicum]|uniref:Type VI secretion system membrane subunit TssM n=1 Tax=Sinobacterium norvegicum TaxID=1641715 RepID=A0ABN8EJB8_9GAMM|nr:type VI secretion system membrane subunit TssM [Sinobacterium norvegicum]CAH0990146.1 hypothetical protein SIN8267_00231 [Sinobacterium norvegicum]